MKYLLSLLFLITFSASESLTGKVIRVIDGDTLVLLFAGNKQERIRLLDIDAPENGQDFSEKSRQFLAGMVSGKTFKVDYKKRDQYKRILGVVFIDGTNGN